MQAQHNLTTSLSWEDLGVKLNPTVLEVLKQNNFTKTTPVQVHTLPLFLSHKDVAVQACTGSGKTLAFAIPLVEIILRSLANQTTFLPNQIAGLVITPIRELAKQVKEVIEMFAEPLGMKTILLIGGSSPEEDKQLFIEHAANPSKGLIVVGTPGKLESALYSTPQLFNPRQLEVLIMDEADSLLEMGFEASLNKILQKLPKQRRTGLFSATQTKELVQLIRAGLRNPVQVNVKVNSGNDEETSNSERVIPATLDNYYCIIPVEEKLSQLVHLLANHSKQKIICYFLTCAQVNYFWTVLHNHELITNNNVVLHSLHGKVPHSKRKGIYETFIKQDFGVLFTTDVAARGLDFPSVDWVVQFDAPQHPDQFVHRIGRTARMGKSGKAVVYISEDQEDYIAFLRNKSIPIEEIKKESNVVDITQSIRKQAKGEREIFEKGQLAFVSFVRAYKEHACSYIFRLSRVDLGNVANGFGLLMLPKMPELSNPHLTINFNQQRVDVNSIKFKDKKRERARKKKLKQLQKKQEERANQLKPIKVIKKSDPWSMRKRRKAIDDGFEVKKSVDAEQEEEWNDDWEQFREEQKLNKRRRKGKLSKREYDREIENIRAIDEFKEMASAIPSNETEE